MNIGNMILMPVLADPAWGTPFTWVVIGAGGREEFVLHAQFVYLLPCFIFYEPFWHPAPILACVLRSATERCSLALSALRVCLDSALCLPREVELALLVACPMPLGNKPLLDT